MKFQALPYLSVLVLAAGMFASPKPLQSQAGEIQSPQATPPAQIDVQALGERLRQLKGERDDAASQAALVPLETQSFAPEPKVKGEWSALRLDNTMNGLTAIWTFEPIEGTGRSTIRVPLALRGEQAIVLAPGAWNATLLVGQSDSGQTLRLPARRIELRNHVNYRLALTTDVERTLLTELRARPASGDAATSRTR